MQRTSNINKTSYNTNRDNGGALKVNIPRIKAVDQFFRLQHCNKASETHTLIILDNVQRAKE